MAVNFTCVICNQTKGERAFAKHKNDLLHSSLSICKSCINTTIAKGGKDSAISACQLLNVPYLEKTYREVVEEGHNNFTDYLRQIAPFKKLYLLYRFCFYRS